MSSPASTQATATGTVVDYAANTPLSGVPVAIAPNTLGATPSPVATTNANGQFSFTAAAGTYLLVIGSNTPVTPTNTTGATTTLTTQITLKAGANALTAPIPPVEANVTPTASQLSGNFRLTALSGTQLDCFTGANQGRSQDSLPLMIPDEYLTESATAGSQQAAIEGGNGALGADPLLNSATAAGPNGVFTYETSIGGIPANAGTADGFGVPGVACDTFTGPSFSYVSGSDPFPFATNAANIYYGVDAVVGTPNAIDGAAAQLWAIDPRPATSGSTAKVRRK
jgi:hypothetical protein